MTDDKLENMLFNLTSQMATLSAEVKSLLVNTSELQIYIREHAEEHKMVAYQRDLETIKESLNRAHEKIRKIEEKPLHDLEHKKKVFSDVFVANASRVLFYAVALGFLALIFLYVRK